MLETASAGFLGTRPILGLGEAALLRAGGTELIAEPLTINPTVVWRIPSKTTLPGQGKADKCHWWAGARSCGVPFLELARGEVGFGLRTELL
jgi:hypothetical protein